MSNSGGISSFDATDLLRRTEAFSGLDEVSLERLAGSVTTEMVDTGHVLMTEGDASNDAYIVITGRLEVRASDAAGNELTVGELGPGDIVGEMALLTGAPRSATVQALRDTLLVHLTRAACLRIARMEPHFMIDLARVLVARLDRSIHDRTPLRARSVVCIIPAGMDGDHRGFVDGFAAALRSRMSVAVVGREDVKDVVGPAKPLDAVVSFLQRTESMHDVTLLVGDELGDAWTQLCARQTDVILLVGTASGLKVLSDAERTLRGLRTEDVNLRSHLVIMHDGASPSHTRKLLEMRDVERHHHVRLDDKADLARLARIVMGTSVGLVLSGGGARGFAHFGVIRALVEAGVPIDHIGGSSIGASVGADYAMGWDWDVLVANERYVTLGQGRLIDYTLPVLAMGRGGRLTSGIRKVFGDSDIADLWFDFFCVSTDLTAGESRACTQLGLCGERSVPASRSRGSSLPYEPTTATSLSTGACSTTSRSTQCAPFSNPARSSLSTSEDRRLCRPPIFRKTVWCPAGKSPPADFVPDTEHLNCPGSWNCSQLPRPSLVATRPIVPTACCPRPFIPMGCSISQPTSASSTSVIATLAKRSRRGSPSPVSDSMTAT